MSEGGFVVAATVRDIETEVPRIRGMLPPSVADRIVLLNDASTDGTRDLLADWAVEDPRVWIGSTATREPRHPREATLERAQHFARIRNMLLDILRQWDWEHVLFFDAGKHLTHSLLAALWAYRDLDVVGAWPVLDEPGHRQHGMFYDVWCYRHLDGHPFSAMTVPRHPGPLLVGSVGGVVQVRRWVVDAGVQFGSERAEDCDWVGFCAEAKAAGAGVWALPQAKVWCRRL
jgi:hypothetical protein